MDPLWIGGILLAILILVLVLAYLLFYNEQSFEDALASQKASSDMLIHSKSSSGKAGLRNRKKPKKARTKSEGESAGEKVTTNTRDNIADVYEASDEYEDTPLDEAAHLFRANPEKLESSEEEKPAQKPKKKSKEKRKSESHVHGSSPSKEQEPTPVQDKIIIQESFVKTNAEPTLEGLPPMMDEEEALFTKEEQIIPTANSSKKAKKSKAAKDKHSNAEPMNFKTLMDALENCNNLSHSDIQKLVDILLDKQKSADQWKKTGGKPDPMDVLRKQLNEKELAFKEEHSRADSLAVKIKELRDELVQEKTKQRNIDGSAAQRIKTLEKENEALQSRMNMIHKNNEVEREKLVEALEICKKTQSQNDRQQLEEELASAKNFIQHSEKVKADLDARIAALEADVISRKESESILIQQAAEANDRVKSFDAVKNSLTQQLMETVKSKSESEQRLDMAKKDVESAHAEKSSANHRAGALQSQLDEERSKKAELEKMFKALEFKLKDTSDKHVQEKEMLARQLANEKKDDTQIAELQKQCDDASTQLDELKAKLAQAEEDHGKTKQSLSSKEEQLIKHQGMISNLTSLNSSKDEEIDVLRKAVSEHENEIVVMKNSISQELQSAPPEVDDAKVKTLEEEIEKLNQQLNQRKEQVATWEKSIESMKTKNNELREKNWKAMDALSAAEKQHKVEVGKAVASAKQENKKNLQELQINVKEFLCRIHPTLSIDKELPYENFLKEYENETNELSYMSSKSESNDSKLEELEEELKKSLQKNEQLSAECAEYKITIDSKENKLNELLKKNEELDTQCNKYKTTLGSTENMLHELEDSVESEMASLKVTIEKKDAIIAERDLSLSELKEKLQKALDDVKSKKEQVLSIEQELLQSQASSGDNDAELQKMTVTVAELKESLKKSDEDAKMKKLTYETLQQEVANKDSELKKRDSSLGELEEKLRKALDDVKSKDEQVVSLQQELSQSQASSGDNDAELQKMTVTVAELKESLKKSDEDAKMKELKFKTLQQEVSNKDSELKKANASVVDLKESAKKASDDSKSKDAKINSLQLELSTLKTAAATSSNASKNELKKLSDEVERLKGVERDLREQVEKAKNEAKARAEEDNSPELEKYKNQATDAAKVNAALRKELEEVRMAFGESKSSSPKKKHHKESEAKVKALEEKLALAEKRESELQATIAHLEESTSTTSLDEDTSTSDKEKKKKRGFSLLGSKSNKYETKYRDVSEKYEQLKTESESKITELENKLQSSEKALQVQEQKVKELMAQSSNGGLQNSGKPLSESQMKQMDEAMEDGEGAV